MTPKRVLMCPPDYYGIEYEINPWMSKSRQPNKVMAQAQWRELRNELKKAGLLVVVMPPVSGLPDMVFTANAGLMYQDETIVLSNFRHRERRGETKHFGKFFIWQGYVADLLPPGMFFEGEGDALFCDDMLVCGYGMRSDERGVRFVAKLVDIDPILLKLVDPYFYHLDTCFSYIKKDLLLCYLPAFSRASRKKIETIGEVIPVSKYDAKNFVCNAVPVGNKLITSPMSSTLRAKLGNYGIGPIEINMSEFIKAGGAAKCLTLFL